MCAGVPYPHVELSLCKLALSNLVIYTWSSATEYKDFPTQFQYPRILKALNLLGFYSPPLGAYK